MDRTGQLKDLYAKIEEVEAQVVQIKSIANTLMFMNEETNLGSAKDTKLRRFLIDGRSFPNSTEKWTDGFRAICDILSIIYRDRFEKVLDPDNLKFNRYWFSKDPDIQFTAQHNSPNKIRNTGIFVDTYGDSNMKKLIIERLSELFECQIFLDYYTPT